LTVPPRQRRRREESRKAAQESVEAVQARVEHEKDMEALEQMMGDVYGKSLCVEGEGGLQVE